jgi:hypothetical protein
MIVYRVCEEKEIQSIICNKSLDEVGCTYKSSGRFNNHKYVPNKNYLHFFKEYDGVFYIGVNRGMYICSYDIPDEILERFAGIGYYLDRTFFRKKEMVLEYAIPCELLSIDYLKKVEKVTSYIDFEEYVYDDYKNKLYTMYDFSEPGKKLRNTLV